MNTGASLRRGWTTGACATGAAKAAFTALLTGEFPDPVTVVLPRGKSVTFPLAVKKLDAGSATVGIVKDAGDDPDVTHGALILATVRRGEPGSAVTFRAGVGIGTVTKPGLPVAIGEPAINPVPRSMIYETITNVAQRYNTSADAIVEISIPNGVELAKKTMNGRLGIVGGLSILGTTGIVIPYSCSAWIAAIHEGIDVARALGLEQIAGATGSTSEQAVARHLQLSESALIDMGDFVGGMLKYLRRHPVSRVTIAGGFAKMSKLAQGALDLHSSRSTLDLSQLSERAAHAGASSELQSRIAGANSGMDALQLAQDAHIPLADLVARDALRTAADVLNGTAIALDLLVVDREGNVLAWAT